MQPRQHITIKPQPKKRKPDYDFTRFIKALIIRKNRMSDKPIGCTQFTDRECRKEDCCKLEIWKNPDKFIEKYGYLVKPDCQQVQEVNKPNWSISCEK